MISMLDVIPSTGSIIRLVIQVLLSPPKGQRFPPVGLCRSHQPMLRTLIDVFYEAPLVIDTILRDV